MASDALQTPFSLTIARARMPPLLEAPSAKLGNPLLAVATPVELVPAAALEIWFTVLVGAVAVTTMVPPPTSPFALDPDPDPDPEPESMVPPEPAFAGLAA